MISHTESNSSNSVANSSLLAFFLSLSTWGSWLLLYSMIFTIRRLFILLSVIGQTNGGCSHEYVGIGLLQFTEHFLPVLSLQKTARKQFYWLKNLLLESRVGDDRNGPLQHIVSKLVRHKPLYDLIHTELATSGLLAELPCKDLVVPIVRALENLIQLLGSLCSLQALLDNIGREL